jgi:pellino protein
METKAHHRKGNQLDPLIQAVIDASQDKKNKNPFQHTEYSTSQEDICVDGLTKNGVRLYLPDMKQWFEVSVNGCMYPIELKAPATSSSGSKSARDSTFNRPNCQQRSSHISNLFNGCIIDLGGIQLQFRSPVKSFVAQGEAAMITDGDPNKSENVLATVVSQLEKLNVQCPVQLHSLSFKAPDEGEVIPLDQIPHVFPACGHVFGYEKRLAKSKQCPMCRKSGHLIKLLLKENSELVRPEDRHVIPECVFNPCGHAVPNTFAQQYAQIIMPNGRSICPFCGVHLDVQKPFSRLYLYSDNNTTDHVSISLTN